MFKAFFSPYSEQSSRTFRSTKWNAFYSIHNLHKQRRSTWPLRRSYSWSRWIMSNSRRSTVLCFTASKNKRSRNYLIIIIFITYIPPFHAMFMDNSLILNVVFGIRKHWKHLYKVFHCVFCFGTVFLMKKTLCSLRCISMVMACP